MENRFIVAVGSSAGGLEPMKVFFENTLSGHASYLIVHHLPINYESRLGDILNKHSNLEIIEAEDGTLIESNKVYIQPSAMYMTIQNDRLYLHQRSIQSLYPNQSIDIFLSSLAVAKGAHSIAVILSGSGSDGTKGAVLIKEKIGMVIVQTPQCCEYNSMPLSVIQTGAADYELLPHEMPDIIHKHMKKWIQKNK